MFFKILNPFVFYISHIACYNNNICQQTNVLNVKSYSFEMKYSNKVFFCRTVTLFKYLNIQLLVNYRIRAI